MTPLIFSMVILVLALSSWYRHGVLTPALRTLSMHLASCSPTTRAPTECDWDEHLRAPQMARYKLDYSR